MKNKNSTKRFNAAVYVLFSILCVFSFNVFAQQYAGSPVTKNRLVTVLRSKSLQTREIVKVIVNKGVDFQINPTVEAELVSAGARPEIIAAARTNYRAPAGVKPSPVPLGKNNKFTGTPLGAEAIVTLLENGVGDAQVRKNIQARGVNFKATPQIKAEIKKAGGSVAMINLIALSYVVPNVNPVNPADAGSNVVATNAADKYDNLVEKAVDLYDNKKDKQGAISSLQEAVKLEPNNSRAYQLLGFMNLYGVSNYIEAERYMKESLSRGGSAVMRVFHDHDGFFKDTCKGSLYVAKDTVRFESDDNVHTFQTADSDIQKIKTNSVFKRAFQTKNGSFQIVLKTGEKDGVKFSFAPLTDNIAESKMIIRLIGKSD
jgi:hypothetical protein